MWLMSGMVWNPGISRRVREIAEMQLVLIKTYRELVDLTDESVRSNWPVIVAATIGAGVDDDDIRRETGASPSTLYRWLHDQVAPREGTRRLMKRAFLDLVDQRLSDVEEKLSRGAA